MNKEKMEFRRCRGSHGKNGRGPTSYLMQDPEMVFMGLGLKNGITFLDLGCGPGDYSIHAAKVIGNEGLVYGLDTELPRLEALKKQAEVNCLKNIKTFQADMTDKLPFEDLSIDYCLMSTSLHCMDLNEFGPSIFTELKRILKPRGEVAVLECKKEKADFGPPMHMRISAEDIEALAEPLGFRKVFYMDLGFNYLVRFEKN